MFVPSQHNRTLRNIALIGFLSGCLFFYAAFAHAQQLTGDQAAQPGQSGPGSSNQTTNPTSQAIASTSGALLRDGIFGCNANKYQNPGSLAAIGGVYVPVNDAAVTLNTGYLVYKECVLDGVVASIRNDAVAGLQSQVLKAAETSREGNPVYLRNFSDLNPYFTALTVNLITDARTGNMCNAFKNRVTAASARSYLASQSQDSSLTCSFESANERDALIRGKTINWNSWMKLIEPSGYELGQYYLLEEDGAAQRANYGQNIREMLAWGRGTFPTFDQSQDPRKARVITPSFLIADSLSKMMGLGTDILVNADEIDQVNGSLQAGLAATLVTDALRGLSGLSRSQNGQPSYLDRMSMETSSTVRSSAVNAAISILSSARQIEATYRAAKEALANALTASITKLRGAENACWELIVPKVREYASGQGASIRIATTTAASQKIIDENIQPVAQVVVNDLRASDSTITILNQIISSVTNTSSATAQRSALERLDSMVANGQLHTAQDAQNASKQREDVTNTLNILVDDTIKAWGDSTDPNVGWCNVNNTAVIEKWFNAWKQ